MYKLYHMPGSCSSAVHAIINELDQPVDLILAKDVENYKDINPNGAVPVLDDGGLIIKEGAAIVLHLLEKHTNQLLPKSGYERTNTLQWLMFANATMHPAYSKLFFAMYNIEDEEVKLDFFKKAASAIDGLWQNVDAQLAKTKYVSGEQPSAADFLLTVFANWGQFFPVEITFGENVTRLIKDISQRPSFQSALQKEQIEYKAA